MNRYSNVLALAIVSVVGVLASLNDNALARVLDGLGDWTALPDAPDATTQELPVFVDVATAHHRATEIVDCIQLDTAKRDAEFRLTWTTQNMSSRDVERHEQVLAGLKATIGRLEAKHACSSVTIESAAIDLYPTLLAAAKLGDTSSAACYASAIVPLPDGKKSPEDIRMFRTTANEFVNSGIDRGDWKFVETMTQATGSLGHRFDWFGHLVHPSREQGYRYRKLLRLAATGSYAVDLDDELASLAKHLSPETIQAMDTQAKKDYDAHFVNSPMLNERPVSCEMNESGM